MNRLLFSLGLSFAVACAKQLPPPKTPEQTTPTIKIPPPPPPGTGRVVLDVVDGPAIVEEVISQTVVTTQQGGGTFTKSAQYNGPPVKRKLCVTPCVLDLPIGPHTLALTTTGSNAKKDETAIVFSEVPMVYRRALGTKERKPLWFAGIGLNTVGAGVLAAGVISLLVQPDDGQKDPPLGFDLGMMFAGAVLIGGGSFMMKANQPIKQEGSETFWALTVAPSEPIATKPPPLQDPGFKPTKPNPETDMERAAKIFDEARARYNLQEYDEALKGFKEAYLLSKEPGLLFNIGQCYRQMGKKDEAIRSFKAYLNEQPDAPQRAQIEEWLKELGEKL